MSYIWAVSFRNAGVEGQGIEREADVIQPGSSTFSRSRRRRTDLGRRQDGLVVYRALIEPREDAARRCMDDGAGVVLAGEAAYCFHVVEHRDRDEVDLFADVSSEEVRALVAGHPPNPREDFGPQHTFVLVGVLGLGPTVPDSADHEMRPKLEGRRPGGLSEYCAVPDATLT